MALEKSELRTYPNGRHLAVVKNGDERDLHPHENGGVLLEGCNSEGLQDASNILNLVETAHNLESSSAIVLAKVIDQEEIPNGLLRRYGIITESGYPYSGLVCLPTKKVESEVPTVETASWWTSGRGFFEHTGRTYVKEGLPYVFLGQEGSYRPSLKNFRLPKEGISLARSAAALLSFSREVASKSKFLLHPTDRVIAGKSRGGMAGYGAIALSDFFGENILYSDITAACFPRGMRVSDMHKLAHHLKSEPRSIGQLGGKLTLKQLVHYPSTLDLNPIAIMYQLGIAPALLSGETGDLARLIDRDQTIHVTGYEEDPACMLEVQEEIFKNFDNVRVSRVPGSHLSIADRETQAYNIARRRAYIRLGGEAIKKVEIDSDVFFDLAHEMVELPTAA